MGRRALIQTGTNRWQPDEGELDRKGNVKSINPAMLSPMSDSLERLYVAVLAATKMDPPASRTARLVQAGRPKMAKKLAEEAVEVLLEAVRDDRDAVIRESADLLYHVVVLWTACGVLPNDVWNEMDRRERLLGMAEKLPKHPQPRPQVWPLDTRRIRKRR